MRERDQIIETLFDEYRPDPQDILSIGVSIDRPTFYGTEELLRKFGRFALKKTGQNSLDALYIPEDKPIGKVLFVYGPTDRVVDEVSKGNLDAGITPNSQPQNGESPPVEEVSKLYFCQWNYGETLPGRLIVNKYPLIQRGANRLFDRIINGILRIDASYARASMY